MCRKGRRFWRNGSSWPSSLQLSGPSNNQDAGGRAQQRQPAQPHRSDGKPQRREIFLVGNVACREGKWATAWDPLKSVRQRGPAPQEKLLRRFYSAPDTTCKPPELPRLLQVDIDRRLSHHRREILRRASDHGMGFTDPESSSLNRRSISCFQASSASSSTS